MLIADDLNILRTICRNPVDCEHRVSNTPGDQAVLEIGSANHPDAIDLNLNFTSPNMNGIEICHEKCETSHCPIIILSMAGPDGEKIQVLVMRADNCLDAAFNMDEFLAHIRPILSRWIDSGTAASQKSHLIVRGDLLINGKSREVTLRGGKIKLTRTEFDLLTYLAEHSGNVATHSELLREVWGPEFSTRKEFLRVFISQLRHKIETDPVDPHYILTVPGVGYRFRDESI